MRITRERVKKAGIAGSILGTVGGVSGGLLSKSWKGALLGASIGAGIGAGSSLYGTSKKPPRPNKKDVRVLKRMNGENKKLLPVSSYKEFYKSHPSIPGKFNDSNLPNLSWLSEDGLDTSRYLPIDYKGGSYKVYDLSENKLKNWNPNDESFYRS